MPPARRPRSRRKPAKPGPLLAGLGSLQAAVAPPQARRCLVCGSDRAHWGFGPPLTPKLVFACREHRVQVDEELTGVPDWLR
jgi:hypothetical protein